MAMAYAGSQTTGQAPVLRKTVAAGPIQEAAAEVTRRILPSSRIRLVTSAATALAPIPESTLQLPPGETDWEGPKPLNLTPRFSNSPPRRSMLLEGDGRIGALGGLGVVKAGDLKASVDLALEQQTGFQLSLGNIEPVTFHGWPGEEAGENADANPIFRVHLFRSIQFISLTRYRHNLPRTLARKSPPPKPGVRQRKGTAFGCHPRFEAGGI